MWYRKPILLAIATGFGLRLLAEPASTAAQAEVVQPTVAALHAAVQDGEMVGKEQQRRVFMNVGGRRFMLVVPQGFRADIANPEKVVLVDRDYTCFLSFRITTPGSVAAASLNADLCRAWLSARLDEPTYLEEFSLTAANGSGPAFDLIAKVDGVARSFRVTFISSPVGILEFTASSSPEKFQAAKSTLQILLRGFQISDVNGQLKILPAQGET